MLGCQSLDEMKGFWGRLVVAGEQHQWPAQIYSGCTCVKVRRLASIEGYPNSQAILLRTARPQRVTLRSGAFVSGHIIKGEAAKNLPPTLPSAANFSPRKLRKRVVTGQYVCQHLLLLLLSKQKGPFLVYYLFKILAADISSVRSSVDEHNSGAGVGSV
jgi:hypothetical protein